MSKREESDDEVASVGEIGTEEHESEWDFDDKVERYLVEHYGEENVEDNRRLEENDRIADFFVKGPLTTFAIEVENDFEACIKGTGQAIIYAHDRMGVTPIVITPKDHIEYPEASALNEQATIVELDL